MSSIYKQFTSNDKVSTRTLLHEAIPITGSILSGTYNDSSSPPVPTNCKNFAHAMFQSIYDYPYLSSSSNHIFDISVGVLSSSSGLHGSVSSQQAKKNNIYNQMAQVLMGYDSDGSILAFDEDGNIAAGGTKLTEVFFMNFSRLLVKDEIQKGTFELELCVDPTFTTTTAMTNRIKLIDYSGSSGYFVNSPAGEYGILYATSSAVTSGNPNLQGESLGSTTNSGLACGLIFYQAGVAVISGSVFNRNTEGGILNDTHVTTSMQLSASSHTNGFTFITGSNIDVVADGIRNRIYNVQFNNTIELNSTVYFCRVNHNEFNYSANPTYLSSSQVVVKNQATDQPVSYVTSIGLYSSDGMLLGVSKLSEPIKKTPSEEYIFRCRVDY